MLYGVFNSDCFSLLYRILRLGNVRHKTLTVIVKKVMEYKNDKIVCYTLSFQ